MKNRHQKQFKKAGWDDDENDGDKFLLFYITFFALLGTIILISQNF